MKSIIFVLGILLSTIGVAADVPYCRDIAVGAKECTYYGIIPAGAPQDTLRGYAFLSM